jgi:hypothetical protein
MRRVLVVALTMVACGASYQLAEAEHPQCAQLGEQVVAYLATGDDPTGLADKPAGEGFTYRDLRETVLERSPDARDHYAELLANGDIRACDQAMDARR